VIEGQSLIIVVGRLGAIQLNGLLKPFQSQIIFLILEIAQPQIILRRRILLKRITSLSQIRNRFRILFNLPITITTMKQSFEVSLTRFYVFKSLGKVLDRVGEVHQSGVHQTAVEVVETIVGFQGYCFLEFCEGVVDLVEHHHAVASVCVVLWVFIVKANRSTEIIHGFLVVADRHKCVTSISMIFGMS